MYGSFVRLRKVARGSSLAFFSFFCFLFSWNGGSWRCGAGGGRGAGVGFETSCDHALSPLFFLFLLVSESGAGVFRVLRSSHGGQFFLLFPPVDFVDPAQKILLTPAVIC
jgi:hypothetical protein